jgi:hypothetical protein
MYEKSCNKPIKTTWFDRKYYTVNKQFTVYLGGDGRYLTRNDYGVKDGKPYIYMPRKVQTQINRVYPGRSFNVQRFNHQYKIR